MEMEEEVVHELNLQDQSKGAKKIGRTVGGSCEQRWEPAWLSVTPLPHVTRSLPFVGVFCHLGLTPTLTGGRVEMLLVKDNMKEREGGSVTLLSL